MLIKRYIHVHVLVNCMAYEGAIYMTVFMKLEILCVLTIEYTASQPTIVNHNVYTRRVPLGT